MATESERATAACGTCHAQVQELRRGRCWGCYTSWVDNRPVGRGAQCVVCDDKRRDNLRMTEIFGRFLAMCHNCTAKANSLSPVPADLDALKLHLNRERRLQEQRQGAEDQRIFPRERRMGERRDALEGNRDKTNPSIVLAHLEDMLAQINESDVQQADKADNG